MGMISPVSFRRVLIALNTAFGILLLFSIPALLFMPMLFAAPGSKSSPLTISLALSVGSYPLLFGLAYWKGWELFQTGASQSKTLTIALLPLVSLAWALATVLLISVLCHGQLVCGRLGG